MSSSEHVHTKVANPGTTVNSCLSCVTFRTQIVSRMVPSYTRLFGVSLLSVSPFLTSTLHHYSVSLPVASSRILKTTPVPVSLFEEPIEFPPVCLSRKTIGPISLWQAFWWFHGHTCTYTVYTLSKVPRIRHTIFHIAWLYVWVEEIVHTPPSCPPGPRSLVPNCPWRIGVTVPQ